MEIFASIRLWPEMWPEAHLHIWDDYIHLISKLADGSLPPYALYQVSTG